MISNSGVRSKKEVIRQPAYLIAHAIKPHLFCLVKINGKWWRIALLGKHWIGTYATLHGQCIESVADPGEFQWSPNRDRHALLLYILHGQYIQCACTYGIYTVIVNDSGKTPYSCILTGHWSERVDDRSRTTVPLNNETIIGALLQHLTTTPTPPTCEL